MNLHQYRQEVNRQVTPDIDKVLEILRKCENDLFCGKEEIQPLKIYQLQRIYRLAKNFIEFLVVLYPYIKIILPYLVKIFRR